MQFRKIEFIKNLFNVFIISGISSLVIYSIFLSCKHIEFEQKYKITPIVEIPYNVLDIKLNWFNGIYLAHYKFEFVKNNRKVVCEFEEVPKEDFMLQRNLKVKIIEDKVYKTIDQEINCK